MYRLTFHPDIETFVLRFEGRFDVPIGKQAFLDIVRHPSFTPASRIFWDVRAVDDAIVEFGPLFGAVQSVIAALLQFTAESRAVILVEDDTHFGMARMLEQIVDAVSPLRVRVARTLAEAERHLALPEGLLSKLTTDASDDLPEASQAD